MAVPFMLGGTPAMARDTIARGHLRSLVRQGQVLVPAGPCYQAWAARMLGQIIYPADQAIEAAVAALATSGQEVVKPAAQRSLQAIQTVTS